MRVLASPYPQVGEGAGVYEPIRRDTSHHLPGKRTFDILFSLLALILGAPVFILLGLLTFFSYGCRANPIYCHVRIGRGGKPFRCYKFRTMIPNAERHLEELLKRDVRLREEWERQQKLKADPRVTRLGRFMRRTSLDELPQFWNVLLGDLSVVGPRPLVRTEVTSRLRSHANSILRVRPGLTGPWQISGRNDTTYEERIGLDKEYVQNRTLIGDFLLVLKTIPAMVRSLGAY